jgi:hypothetical protein
MESLEEIVLQRRSNAITRALLADDGKLPLTAQSLEDDSLSTGTVEDMIDREYEMAYEELCKSRYLCHQKKYRDRRHSTFERDLGGHDGESSGSSSGEGTQFLSEEEFMQAYRMKRDSFYKLVEMIKGHPVFLSQVSRCPQAPAAHHLLVFLHYVEFCS